LWKLLNKRRFLLHFRRPGVWRINASRNDRLYSADRTSRQRQSTGYYMGKHGKTFQKKRKYQKVSQFSFLTVRQIKTGNMPSTKQLEGLSPVLDQLVYF
jgi:hypothetical protein